MTTQRAYPIANQTASALIEAVDAVRVSWAAQGEFTPATLEKCGETIARFGRRLEHQGVIQPGEVTAGMPRPLSATLQCTNFPVYLRASTRSCKTPAPSLETKRGASACV